MCPRYPLKLDEEEGSLLRPQTAAATSRAEVRWDEASTDEEESEEELEMTEGEDDVELSGNSDLYCAMTGDVVSLIEQEIHLREEHASKDIYDTVIVIRNFSLALPSARKCTVSCVSMYPYSLYIVICIHQ